MQLFKQSTAVTISIGPCLDADGAEYAGLVIGDLTLTKNGASAAMASAATLTATSNGHYDLVTTTGNMDALGRLRIRCDKSTYQIPVIEGMVVPAMVYDSLVAGTDVLQADVTQILGSALTETSSGYLAAGLKKLLDVASPVFTLASVNQAGDSYAIVNSGTHGNAALKTDLDNVPKSDGTVAFNTTAVNGIQSGLATSANVTSILNAISGLNNLSALANLYGSPLLEIPDSGDPDAVYAFTLVVRDNEGKLVALDGSPTIAAANAAGTDRSANLSAVSNPATGRYTFTYSVADDATPESLRIACSGTVSAEGRYVEWGGAVVDYDTLSTLLEVKAKTDLIPAAPASAGDVTSARDDVLTRIGTPAGADLATDIAAVKADTGNLVTRIPAALFSGITSLAQWLGLMAGKQTGNTTARSELRATGAGSGTFNETTDSLEAVRDRGDSAWTTGSGGGSGLTGPYTLAITIEDAADDSPIEGASVRLYRSGETETQASDVAGETEFTVEAATWSYAVIASGYAGATGAIVVSDDGASTIQLTASAVTPPASPSLSAIEVLCLDSTGQIESGVDVDIRMVAIPGGSQNMAFKGAKQTATSGVDGIARFEVVQGSTCEWKRGAADAWQRISVDSDGVTNVTSVIGSP